MEMKLFQSPERSPHIESDHLSHRHYLLNHIGDGSYIFRVSSYSRGTLAVTGSRTGIAYPSAF